ncbi:hypothetical protein B5X24_HaOG203954 [Helicoverpa armigera]|uniref:FLYWCH-type domain-containing protein n=1 Tax=Helicoverpa armigera TaxID=29058 RepID=A0A2W1BYZ1_HELAM|nr:hypothetical protein B5X24_HaOG203954 [Helicoverpa armigera]
MCGRPLQTYFYEIEKAVFVPGRYNRMILYGGNHFINIQDKRLKNAYKERWGCSKRMTKSCRAKLTTIGDTIVKIDGTKAEFVLSQKGNVNIVIDEYKFYKKQDSRRSDRGVKSRWVCSKGLRGGCRARVITVADIIVSCGDVLPFAMGELCSLVYVNSGPVPKSEHQLTLKQGEKAKIRRYCIGCYRTNRATMGRINAKNKTRQVFTVCQECPNMPHYCVACFKEAHENGQD